MLKKWLVFDFLENEFSFETTEELAIKAVNEILQIYRDMASEEWPEDMAGNVGYAEVKAVSKMINLQKKADFDENELWPGGDNDEICDFELKEIECR